MSVTTFCALMHKYIVTHFNIDWFARAEYGKAYGVINTSTVSVLISQPEEENISSTWHRNVQVVLVSH